MDVILELFSFQGRVNRAWYFWHTFLDGAVAIGLILAIVIVGGMLGNPLFALPAVGVAVAAGVAELAITVKRLHDIGRPGWHWWLLLIPFYNIYLGLSLLFKRGSIGPNEFGTDPLGTPAPVGYIEGDV